MAKLSDDPKYMNQTKNFCDWVVNDAPMSPKGMVYLDQWGSLRHAANVALICLNAAELGINVDTYRSFAKKQIGYALGDSGRSFVCGYGVNPPVQPHHRASSCPDQPSPCDHNNAMNNPGANYQTLYGGNHLLISFHIGIIYMVI
jgi:endoglucanase